MDTSIRQPEYVTRAPRQRAYEAGSPVETSVEQKYTSGQRCAPGCDQKGWQIVGSRAKTFRRLDTMDLTGIVVWGDLAGLSLRAFSKWVHSSLGPKACMVRAITFEGSGPSRRLHVDCTSSFSRDVVLLNINGPCKKRGFRAAKARVHALRMRQPVARQRPHIVKEGLPLRGTHRVSMRNSGRFDALRLGDPTEAKAQKPDQRCASPRVNKVRTVRTFRQYTAKLGTLNVQGGIKSKIGELEI